MKTILTFLNPLKKFNKEHEELIRIQIDNSLELGWKPEDILLVTNFPYEYNGVKAYIVGDDCYYGKNNFYRSSKIPVINQLFKDGIIKEGEVYWFRDNDAFQLEPIKESDLELGDNVLAITNHGWHSRWNAGSFFFTAGAKDIFLKIRETMDEQNMDEQCALEYMINNNTVEKYKLLNLTYNFGIYKHPYTYKRTRKPLLVAHFHPHKPRHLALYTPLIPDRFKKILENYGLRAIVDPNQMIKDLQALRIHRRMFVWEPFMKKYHCDVICEIGVRAGRHFGRMIGHNPRLAVAVDSWIDDGALGRNDKCFQQSELNEQYENFKKEMENKSFVEIIRGYSFDAVKHFSDEFFDFVYIDADHTFDGCYRDIIDWYPKVKKGGVLAGHDYEQRIVRTKRGRVAYGVVEAVDKLVKDKNISTFVALPFTNWAIIKK